MKKEIAAVPNKEIVSDDVDVFCRLVQSGIDRWIEAGKFLCRGLEKDEHLFSKITSRAPYLTADILVAFKRIGERKLYPYILLDSSVASKRLALMSYDDQVRLYGKPVQVAYQNGDGSFDSYETAPHRLNRQDAEIVFCENGVRTVEEQIVLLKARAGNEKSVKVNGHVRSYPEHKAQSPSDQTKTHLQSAYAALTDAKVSMEQMEKPLKDQFSKIEAVLKTITEIRKSL